MSFMFRYAEFENMAGILSKKALTIVGNCYIYESERDL
jgi:hypothetical protein